MASRTKTHAWPAALLSTLTMRRSRTVHVLAQLQTWQLTRALKSAPVRSIALIHSFPTWPSFSSLQWSPAVPRRPPYLSRYARSKRTNGPLQWACSTCCCGCLLIYRLVLLFLKYFLNFKKRHPSTSAAPSTRPASYWTVRWTHAMMAVAPVPFTHPPNFDTFTLASPLLSKSYRSVAISTSCAFSIQKL